MKLVEGLDNVQVTTLINRTHRGVTEWFNVPVSKTGDPSRDPGVRIPPPLQKEFLFFEMHSKECKRGIQAKGRRFESERD